jgi:CRP-like cAMP-binding protein
MSTSSVEGAREALASLPALAHLSGDARRLVEDSFVAVSYPFGSVIVREGDPADAFYVLVTGSARVVKRGERDQEVPLNRLGPGDGFGEMALIARLGHRRLQRGRGFDVRCPGRAYSL